MKIILLKKLIKENHAVKYLNRYVTIFDYTDKTLIVLSATTGGVSIISFTSIRIKSASFTLIFSLTAGIIKKIIEYNKKKKEKA